MFHVYFIVGFLILLLVLAGVFVFLRLHVASDFPVAYDQPDFRDRAGFRVTGLPGDEIITLEESWLLNRDLAQLDFKIDPNYSATLRVGRTGTDLMLGDFEQNYDERQVRTFDGIRTVTQNSPGGPALSTWSSDGFDYALYFPEAEMNLAGGLTDDFVTETKTQNK